MSRHIDEMDDFAINSGFRSECCDAPIYGEIVGEPPIGICSQCKEWAGVLQEPEEE